MVSLTGGQTPLVTVHTARFIPACRFVIVDTVEPDAVMAAPPERTDHCPEPAVGVEAVSVAAPEQTVW